MSAAAKACLLLLAASIVLLSACGQSGPLTLPEPAAEQADDERDESEGPR